MALGVYRGPGVKVKVKVKVTRWDWDREVADWAYLGIGDLDVPWPLGVYRGPGG